MTGRFRPGTRRQLRLRAAFDGPAGSGKTYTAIRCGFALAPNRRLAVIGTEGSANDDAAEKYIGEPDPDNPGQRWQFDILHLPTFSPSEYTSAIEEAGRLGYEALVIDSLSHAWEGKDGALEQKDRAGGNTFTAWKDITPMHRRMIDAIQSSPCHVIATMRSKQEYVLEKNEAGKEVPRKIGMAPVQRQGMEYEFDIYGSLDWSHILTVTKSRCRSVDGLIVSKPGAGFMQSIIEWLQTGVQIERAAPARTIDEQQTQRVAELLDRLGWTMDQIRRDFPKKYQCGELSQLSHAQANALIGWLEGNARDKQGKAAATVAPAPPTAQATAPAAAATNGTEHKPTPAAAAGPTPQQIEAIQKYRNDLSRIGCGKEQWEALLAPYGTKTAKALTPAQAEQFIVKLREESGKTVLADPTTGDYPPNPDYPLQPQPQPQQQEGGATAQSGDTKTAANAATATAANGAAPTATNSTGAGVATVG